MKKRKKIADISIGKRAYQEVLRLFPKMKDAEKVVGCTDYTIYQWNKGVSPSAIYLARLLELGADIHWILTGRKSTPFTEEAGGMNALLNYPGAKWGMAEEIVEGG